MNARTLAVLMVSFLGPAAIAAPPTKAGAGAPAPGDWPAWRGPTGMGITTETKLPTKWSTTENVRWKAPLPEPGNSTPIVSGKQVFLTQAVGMERTLMSFDRATGKLLWQKGATAKEKDPTHATNPYCSASPVTDGSIVIASFASEGLFAYDFTGKELWKRTDLGKQVHIWGNAASPMIHGDLCYLNFGPGETTYLLAVNKKTGKTVWTVKEDTGYGKAGASTDDGGKKRGNPQYVGSWTTPVIMKIGTKEQLVMTWPRRAVAYDPATGKELWSCTGLNPLVYTSPITDGQVIVAMGGFNGSDLALKMPAANATGDITASNRIWQHPKTAQRIGSAVIYKGHAYIHNDPGTAQCIDLKTGETVWQERLTGPGKGGQNWSSVMLAGDTCYTITQGGDCFVWKANPAKLDLVSVNPLGARSNSSIVPSSGELFIRTHEALWCIADKKK